MPAPWHVRRIDLDSLVLRAHRTFQTELTSPGDNCSCRKQQAGETLASFKRELPGELLDLLAYHVEQHEVPIYDNERLYRSLAERQLSLKRDFTIVHTLAEEPATGTSVSVITANELGSSKRVYAVKSISKPAALKLEGQTSAVHERNILAQARQARVPYAPKLIAATQDATHLHIILEYLPAGDLGLLLSERKVLPLKWVRLWSAECIQALQWLHKLGYAHRDVKPANLLLDLTGHIRLADFASAGPLWQGDNHMSVTKRYCLTPVGTVDYIAPEILLAHEKAIMDSDDEDEEEELDASGPYTVAVDYWSLGVSIYEMLVGKLPFYADTIPETYERITHYDQFCDIDGLRLDVGAKELLRGLLTSENLRVEGSALSSYAFFDEISWPEVYSTLPPYRPAIRCLDPVVGGASKEDFSKGFDFSALFSSPGLSILRTAPEPDDLERRWLGFTFVAGGQDFESLPDDVNASRLLYKGDNGPTVKSPFPITPARSSVSPASNAPGDSRQRHNALALQEVVNYGILKTARKASAYKIDRSAKTAEPAKLEQESPVVTRLPELRRRHEALIADIDDIEQRYRQLLHFATT